MSSSLAQVLLGTFWLILRDPRLLHRTETLGAEKNQQTRLLTNWHLAHVTTEGCLLRLWVLSAAIVGAELSTNNVDTYICIYMYPCIVNIF